MKNKYTLLLLFAAFCCLNIQCKKEDDSYAKELAKLPPYTKKGYNTFGCLINGKAFPQSSEGYHEKMVYYYDGELFINYSTNYSTFDLNEAITLKTNKIHSEGVFKIMPVSGKDQFTYISNENEDIVYASELSLKSEDKLAEIIILRLDTINHISQTRARLQNACVF